MHHSHEKPPWLLPSVKLADQTRDRRNLFFGKLSEYGKRQHFFGELLADREIAGPITVACESRLQMQREGIIDLGSHAGLGQESTQLIPPRAADHKLVVHMTGLIGLRSRRS